MTAGFYFKYEGKSFTGTFSSTDGEEYTVKFPTSPDYYYDGKNMTLVWNKVSSKFIKVFVIINQNEIRSEKTVFVRDQQSVEIHNICQACSGSTIVIIIGTCSHLTQIQPSVTKGATATHKKTTATKKEAIEEKKLEQLSTDMRNLLQTGNLSDVVLTDGTKKIHAHKLILSARSPVFAKMFQHPMKENRENQITIKDVSNEVLFQLLHFMYAGTVIIKDSSMARELYIAADKYDVKDLRDICTKTLLSVDLNSVLDTLLLADLYSDKVLKEAALNFISKNYSQVKALQKWNSFMKEHQNLAIEILSFVIDKKI